MQFSRVITSVEDIHIWNASSNGFSFVISYVSRDGPGLHGNPGFVASWRPVYQNRPAVKVIGSPFKTFIAAEQACEAMLGYLTAVCPSLGQPAFLVGARPHLGARLPQARQTNRGSISDFDPRW